MRALLLSSLVVFGVGSRIAAADPPPPDPGDAVAPDAPPLAPPPPPSSPPAPATAPQWGRTLPLIEAAPYPDALVDRPLTMLDGMTELGVAYELESTTTKAFTNRTPDVGLSHSFGTFQLGANVGETATLTAGIPLAPNTALFVSFDSGAPQADNSLHVAGLADLEYKAHVSPGQCALFFAVGAAYEENRLVDPFDTLVWTQYVLATAEAELEVQVLPNVSLDLGMSLDLPVEASAELVTRSTVNATGSLLVTVAHSWDLDVSGAVADLGTYRVPYLSFGFAKRWGG